MRARGCELISIGDGADLNGPAGEIDLVVSYWKAARLAINERIRAAHDVGFCRAIGRSLVRGISRRLLDPNASRLEVSSAVGPTPAPVRPILGQALTLGEALHENAENADAFVDQFCEESRKLRESTTPACFNGPSCAGRWVCVGATSLRPQWRCRRWGT